MAPPRSAEALVHTALGDPVTAPEHRLNGIASYNPALLSEEELVSYFIARKPLLSSLLADLGRGGVSQHRLLVGQRGMGKTTLLRRLFYAIERDATLRKRWLPLAFPEEQYNVGNLSDFYLNCLDALGDTLERRGQRGAAQTLDGERDRVLPLPEPEREKAALALLLSTAESMKASLLVLADNLDLVFQRLGDQQWRLRELLSAENGMLLVGASAVLPDNVLQHGAAFYDFFKVHELRGLKEDEAREVLLELSRVHKAPHVQRILNDDPVRFRSVFALTGGNPRTLVLFFQVLALDAAGGTRSDLEKLLDNVTPLYKHRIEALSPQHQRIVDAVAVHFHPITSAGIAAHTGIEANAVSSQLSRLRRDGVLEEVGLPGRGKTGYQIAERFFNIWYLMRQSRRVRQKLVWLVELLRVFYGLDELRKRAAARLDREGAPRAPDAPPWATSLDNVDPLLQANQHDVPAGVLYFSDALQRVGALELVRPLAEEFPNEFAIFPIVMRSALEEGDDALALIAPELRPLAKVLVEALQSHKTMPADPTMPAPKSTSRGPLRAGSRKKPSPRVKVRHA